MNFTLIKNLIFKKLFVSALTLFFIINYYEMLILSIILLTYLALSKIIDGEGDKLWK